MKKIPVIPECYKDLPDRTILNSKEVAKMFGYKSRLSIHEAEESKLIPEHESEGFTDCNRSPTGLKKAKYWKLGTIRKWKNDNSI